MRIFGVTENELRTLTIVNAAVAFLFSLGTGCFGYLLNLDAAAAMTEKIPKETEALLKLVQPGLLSLGVAFYVAGAFAWIMRSGFINTIKRESDPQMRQAGRATGRLNRILEAVRS